MPAQVRGISAVTHAFLSFRRGIRVKNDCFLTAFQCNSPATPQAYVARSTVASCMHVCSLYMRHKIRVDAIALLSGDVTVLQRSSDLTKPVPICSATQASQRAQHEACEHLRTPPGPTAQ